MHACPRVQECDRCNGAAACEGGVLFREDTPPRLAEPGLALATSIHAAFQDHVLDPGFSCLGAKAALRGGRSWMAVYDEMASPRATASLARDLRDFVQQQDPREGPFSTFVASFLGPRDLSELAFERQLWAQLQGLHDLDAQRHAWDSAVSVDPEDANFSFSIAGRAFFVVGLHPASSRRARRFSWPTLVFNAHEQFDRLRREGNYEQMRDLIRERELALQGSLNPNLSEFGERSEARQYSGRPVEPGWRCPFQPRTA